LARPLSAEIAYENSMAYLLEAAQATQAMWEVPLGQEPQAAPKRPPFKSDLPA